MVNWDQVVSLAKGTGIAMAGAGLTYLAATLPGVDFGVVTPLVVAGFSVFANWARLSLKNAGFTAL